VNTNTVEAVVIAPSERLVVDLLFDVTGELPLVLRSPGRTYPRATIAATNEPVEPGGAVARGGIADLRTPTCWSSAICVYSRSGTDLRTVADPHE
jgi:hypothetical protein